MGESDGDTSLLNKDVTQELLFGVQALVQLSQAVGPEGVIMRPRTVVERMPCGGDRGHDAARRSARIGHVRTIGTSWIPRASMTRIFEYGAHRTGGVR